MNWIQDHWLEILAIVGGIDIILGVVTKWTKFEWDDNLYTAFHNLVAKFFPKGK